jgi:hypothetical protein
METIAQHIRHYRNYLKDAKDSGSSALSYTAALVDAWNWATCPSRPMTDKEHSACRKLARRCRNELQGRPDWQESESGLLFVSLNSPE